MEERLHKHRAYYEAGRTRDTAGRVQALKKLHITLKRREGDLLRALAADLSKAPEEAYATELGIVYGELRDAIRHLKRWGRTAWTLPSLAQLPGSGRVYRDPYGVVLILAPWNYPVQLTLVPLIAAVAAGNCAVVRPSSSAPRTAQVVATVIAEAFTPGHVTACLGSSREAAQLTHLPFDKIFFTGSPGVGRQVMAAASENLVPVTLELGGKSPAIVAADANLRLAARRIVWGKFINAGQTCVAPDYVLVSQKVQNALLDSMDKEIRRQFGEDPLRSPDLTGIISDRHFERLAAMLDDGKRVCGGRTDAQGRKISPTILTDVRRDSALLRDEIFGPILPVLPLRTMEEALAKVRAMPHPLALYLFTEDKNAARRIIRDMAFGSGCVNDTVIQLTNARLPFGGVGSSGMGQYHGRYGYECFTRPKGVLMASSSFDVPVRYPPWKGKLGILRRVMK